MPMKTAVTEMLGIEHPIVCGGMTATGSAELAAAVSNAGGLGMLTAQHARSPEKLDAMIKHCATLTDKPFGEQGTPMCAWPLPTVLIHFVCHPMYARRQPHDLWREAGRAGRGPDGPAPEGLLRGPGRQQ